MTFHQSGTIRYLSFDSLEDSGVIHAVFTRQGGVSPEPWATLNLGGTVGDVNERVIENRQRAMRALERHPETIYDVWQVHGAEVVCAQKPRPPHESHRRADAILTDRPGVTLLMRFADCVPILLWDPVRRVVGIAHAGWQGTVKGVARETVLAMQAAYRSQPVDIRAAIGPSIGPHHYQVGPDVGEQVRRAFGTDASALLSPQNGAVKFDLWTANRFLLERVGVEQIEVAEICTACHLDDWFSHRGEDGRTGRFGVLIGLKG